jgi:hypothetical protein
MQSIPSHERRFKQDRERGSDHRHWNYLCWARCCPQGHSLAGDLLACCMGFAAYHSLNPRTGLKRTLTLVEDEPACDFRTYTVTGQAGTESGA